MNCALNFVPCLSSRASNYIAPILIANVGSARACASWFQCSGTASIPVCMSDATECHHLHYDTLGFEENTDLKALCSPHHRAQHGL